MKLAFDVLNAQLDAERSEKCRGDRDWWTVQLNDEDYAKLWSNTVTDVKVPEEFGGDMFSRQLAEGGFGQAV